MFLLLLNTMKGKEESKVEFKDFGNGLKEGGEYNLRKQEEEEGSLFPS